MDSLNLNLLKSIPIPTEIREGALALEVRVERFRRKSIDYHIAAGIGAILGLIVYGISVWISPDTYITSAHIPDEVLRVFSDSITVPSTVGSGLGGVSRSLVGYISSFGSFFAVGALTVGLGASLIRGGLAPIVLGLTIACSTVAGPAFLGSLTDGLEPRTSISQKRQLIQMVDAGDIDGVSRAFNVHKVAGGLGDYVLAQTMSIRQKADKKIDGAKFKDLVLRVDRQAQVISEGVSPQVLMTLEIQALGSTQSEIARQYEKKIKSTIDSINVIQWIVKGITWALMCVGIAFLVIKTIIHRRVIRLAALLSEHPKSKLDVYLEKETKVGE